MNDDLKPADPGAFDRELPKAGWHVAVCCQVHGLGYQKFGNDTSIYPQASIIFELKAKQTKGTYEGKPFLVSIDVSNMLPKPDAVKKGRLAETLKAWFGRDYTNNDKAFTLAELVGKSAYLNITHNKGYANIAAIGPLPDEMTAIPVTVTETPKWITDKKAKQVQPGAQNAGPRNDAPPPGDDGEPLPF